MGSKIFQKDKHTKEKESGLGVVLLTHCQSKNLFFDTTPTHTLLGTAWKAPPPAVQVIACTRRIPLDQNPFLLKTEALTLLLKCDLTTSQLCVSGR